MKGNHLLLSRLNAIRRNLEILQSDVRRDVQAHTSVQRIQNSLALLDSVEELIRKGK